MAENKFIQKLKGKQSAKSLIEIEKAGSVASFDSMPIGSSDAQRVYADVRDNAVVIANSAINWKIQNGSLVIADVTGDGQDYSGNVPVSGISTQQGNNLWLDAQYTVPADGMLFTANTKWVLKLCGDNLINLNGSAIDFTIVLKLGATNIITKTFTIAEQANFFNKELVIDFEETNSSAIKLSQGDTITLQLLSGTATASARIYTGMTVLSCLQRKITGDLVDIKGGSIEDLEAEVSQLSEDLDDLEEYVDETFVKKDGSSIMTGPLKFRAGSFEGAIAGGLGDGILVYKLKADGSIDSEVASLTKTNGFVPGTNNAMNIGRNNLKWKDAYIARVITAVLNNGYDIAVPVTNGPDTLALKSEVDTAANSGRMIIDQGVWYAKMYAASTVPTGAEYDGTNYADFSQTDGDGNPVIKIYTGASGVWTLTDTITPPAEYDGYVPITSKIWDIPEQAGQQGGRILWNHQSKEFTPYPQIISFENAALTGTPTAPTPTSSSPNNQIATKEYVDSLPYGANTDLSNLTPTGEAKFTAKANTDMDNLTSTGQNISNWSSNVTNCITNIPQDINLELSSGTLTLKAGSKVYIPNGNNVFDIEDITVDESQSSTAAVADGPVFVFWTSVGLQLRNISKVSSGPNEPTITLFSGWYDTTNNLVKLDASGSAWQTTTVSFPIAKVTVAGGAMSSIDQVFNGFGYIGSTIFALPGVKGLIPDGRNSDGTLKNTTFTINSVLTNTGTGTDNKVAIRLKADEIATGDLDYDETNNYNRHLTTGEIRTYAVVGYIIRTSGVINRLSTKTTFHAIDYNDTEYMAHQAMPSNRYINLTLGATWDVYDAPADGYVVIRKNSTAANQFVKIINRTSEIAAAAISPYSGYDTGTTIPVSKGDRFQVAYTAGGVTNYFRFVYANGAK